MIDARKRVVTNLAQRKEPRRIDREALFPCPRSEYIGQFPAREDYAQVIEEDCDVYVAGKKVVSFRKNVLPYMSFTAGVKERQRVWQFLRKASREVYGTQRGVVAGTEFTTLPEARLTKGQVAFFVQSAAGLITTLEQAHEVLKSSDEFTSKTLKIKYVKAAYPDISERCKPLEKLLKGKNLPSDEENALRLIRRQVLWSWFEPWLLETWLPSGDKQSLTKELMNNFISSQLNFNHCYSNVLGAIDRGARFPYGRLSGTTQRWYSDFERYKEIYAAACESFKVAFPDTWSKVKQVISQVKDPVYNLFGTTFTSITLNFNFRTAYHVDKNNLNGGMAVLSVITQGEYDGHYLVFPELKLAFDVRDGDVIIGDTQALLHGNTPMEKLTENAERISLVFYSRENMTLLDDLECEQCRREFLKFSCEQLRHKSKTHKDWRGVWPEMWISPEWLEFRKSKGLERCSNSNWQLSSPYLNIDRNEVKLHKKDPGEGWEHLEVASFLNK
jgi:hypothetical protein